MNINVRKLSTFAATAILALIYLAMLLIFNTSCSSSGKPYTTITTQGDTVKTVSSITFIAETPEEVKIYRVEYEMGSLSKGMFLVAVGPPNNHRSVSISY